VRAAGAQPESLAHAPDDRPALTVAVVAPEEIRRRRLVAALESDDLHVVTRSPAAGGGADVLVAAWQSPSALAELVEAAEVPVVVVVPDVRAARQAADTRAAGVVLDDSLTSLVSAVAAVAAGHLVLPQQVRDRAWRPVFTSREKQILALVVMGFTNCEIATTLHVTESTVKSHLSSAFRKLGVHSRNRATALILDAENGLGTGILALSGTP
jgi:DNA-binding NarL/FixJ family response regulator